MTSKPKSSRKTLLFPIPLASPSQYERSAFPLKKYKDESPLNQVNYCLEGTLDELVKIRHMLGDEETFRELMRNARTQYDDLKAGKEKLEQQPKSLNPFKRFSAYRSVRMLLDTGTVLYTETKNTSENMRRQMLSVNTDDVQSVDDNDLPADAQVGAISVALDSDSELDETTSAFFSEAASFFASQVDLLGENPFADDFRVDDSQANEGSQSATNPGTSDIGTESSATSRLSGASSLGSPSSGQGSGNNVFIFNNSYIASRSAIQSPTLNNGGSRNQGSSRR